MWSTYVIIAVLSNSEASLEGGQGGQLTPLEFWKVPWKRQIFDVLTPLCVIPSILTPLSEIPNEASEKDTVIFFAYICLLDNNDVCYIKFCIT